jgi:hypothetical protein
MSFSQLLAKIPSSCKGTNQKGLPRLCKAANDAGLIGLGQKGFDGHGNMYEITKSSDNRLYWKLIKVPVSTKTKSVEYAPYKGKKYVVCHGTKGGKYVIVNGEKKYLTK